MKAFSFYNGKKEQRPYFEVKSEVCVNKKKNTKESLKKLITKPMNTPVDYRQPKTFPLKCSLTLQAFDSDSNCNNSIFSAFGFKRTHCSS